MMAIPTSIQNIFFSLFKSPNCYTCRLNLPDLMAHNKKKSIREAPNQSPAL